MKTKSQKGLVGTCFAHHRSPPCVSEGVLQLLKSHLDWK